jgi:hypothetical protein
VLAALVVAEVDFLLEPQPAAISMPAVNATSAARRADERVVRMVIVLPWI